MRAVMLWCYMQSWRYFLIDPNRVEATGSQSVKRRGYREVFSNYSLWVRGQLWQQFRAPPAQYEQVARTIEEIRTRAQLAFHLSDSMSSSFSNQSATHTSSAISEISGHSARLFNTTVALVGVHMRLTDYTTQGAVVADEEYFLFAANHLRTRFHNVYSI